jgi:four helix bundle protein
MKCKTLEVWKRSSRLSANVYKELKNCKDYGFKDQITRACLSVPSNIAEGMEKESLKENNRFLEISRGSMAEFMTQTYIGIEIEYIKHDVGSAWVTEGEEILKMIIGLQKSLGRSVRTI